MNKKDIKLYNIIFPIYMLWLIPPVIFISAILNFIIDSIVVLITKKILKIEDMFKKYKKVILKVWGFGFLSDFIGALFIFIMSIIFEDLAISIYNPFSNIYTLIITLIAILIAGVLIFIFNKKVSFKKIDITEKQKFILALVMAIITAPYLFLLPAIW